jgi:predicted PurR-regulated permease PerM
MPPIWVMLGIFAGSKLLGFLGMIVGVPITAVLYLLFKSYVEEKYIEKTIVEQNT